MRFSSALDELSAVYSKFVFLVVTNGLPSFLF